MPDTLNRLWFLPEAPNRDGMYCVELFIRPEIVADILPFLGDALDGVTLTVTATNVTLMRSSFTKQLPNAPVANNASFDNLSLKKICFCTADKAQFTRFKALLTRRFLRDEL